ncbi:MAG: class I SAM-dependent methyltransferase [Anaerolineae bacterium]
MNSLSTTEEKQAFGYAMNEAKKAWFNALDDYKASSETIGLPHPAVMLTDKHINDCTLLPNRLSILERMSKGGIVAEVGVQTGQFSQIILDICSPAELHLIDLDLKAFGIKDKFQEKINTDIVHLLEGDSSTLLQESFPENYFDFIYIDGDHRYEGVKRDIEAAKSKLKPGGYLLFNDYTYWSPVECMAYGVMQAVNELCLEEDWQMRYFALAHYMYCDVAVQKPGVEKLEQTGFLQKIKSMFGR